MAVRFEFVGSSCGGNSTYTFYKAFKYHCGPLSGILAIGDFFCVKPWTDQETICIAELHLVYRDETHHVPLLSLKLYFLPEDTPSGRFINHGQDEVISSSKKVILKADHLLSWLQTDVSFTRGNAGFPKDDCHWPKPLKGPASSQSVLTPLDSNVPDILPGSGHAGLLDVRDVIAEKEALGTNAATSSVLILSYPAYCRYRAALKRFEGREEQYLRQLLPVALGAKSCPGPNTRIFYCKETFDSVDLQNHPFVCNHLAPKWKAKPRKKRKIRSRSPGSESVESESSGSYSSKKESPYKEEPPNWSDRPKVEQMFLEKLHKFMAHRGTPIGRLPSLGFKQLDLYDFFHKVQRAGGYEAAVSKKLWKGIYIELGGHPSNTSAATCTRKHYEKLLLPYEQLLVPAPDEPAPKKPRKTVGTSEEPIKTESHCTKTMEEGIRVVESAVVKLKQPLVVESLLPHTKFSQSPRSAYCRVEFQEPRSDRKSGRISPEEELVTSSKMSVTSNDLDLGTNQSQGQGQGQAMRSAVKSHSSDSVQISIIEKPLARASVICKNMDTNNKIQLKEDPEGEGAEPPPPAHSQKPVTPLSSLTPELYDYYVQLAEASLLTTSIREPSIHHLALEYALRTPPVPLAASPSIYVATKRIYGDPSSDIKRPTTPAISVPAKPSPRPDTHSGRSPATKGKASLDFNSNSKPSPARPSDVSISLNVKIEGSGGHSSSAKPRASPGPLQRLTVREELKERARSNFKENSRERLTVSATAPKMADSLRATQQSSAAASLRGASAMPSISTPSPKPAPKTSEAPLYSPLMDPSIAAYYSMYSPHLYGLAGNTLAQSSQGFAAAGAAAAANAADISAQMYKDLVQRGYPPSLAPGMPPMGYGLSLPSLLHAMNARESSTSDKTVVPKS